MATAAPAAGAPAPAAPAAAPSTPAGEPTAPKADAAAPQKPIRPIPPPPKLPGVLEDGPEDASTRPPDTRTRDASGRFVAGEPKGGEVVTKPKPSAVEAPDGEPTIPEPPGEAKPFTFAGKPFKTQAEAEQHYKSLEGRFDPIQKAATKNYAKLVEAAKLANDWHEVAQRQEAELQQLRAGQAPAEPAASDPEGIDWGLYAEIRRVANEAGTPEKADQWLQEQHDRILRSEIAKIREEAIETPRRTAEEQAQLAQTADNLVNAMSEVTNPDGSYVFPELRDGKTAHEVGALWRSMGLDPQLALSEGGAVAAVMLYRGAKALQGPAPAPRPSAPVIPTPAPNPAADAAAGLEGGRPLLPAANGRRELDPGTARILAGLKNTQLTQRGLGFEA